MKQEFINTKGQHVVLNGGNPLPGSPDSWEQANEWQNQANKDREYIDGPEWSFDCGFKLDFDGPLLNVSSRFYPPANFYGEGLDGNVTIIFMGTDIEKKKFKCDTFDELTKEVGKYIKSFVKRISIADLYNGKLSKVKE